MPATYRRGRTLSMLAMIMLAMIAAQTDDQAKQAKHAFETGAALFRDAKYAEALPYFEDAYRLSGKRQSAIRALAQCERALEHHPRAIVLFREYLATAPPDARAIEATIRQLEDQRIVTAPQPEPDLFFEDTRAPPPPSPNLVEPDPQPLEETRSILANPILWIVAGVAVIAGAVGVTLALSGERAPHAGTSGMIIEL